VKVRVRAAEPAPSPRAVIEAILMEALPLTEESRTFHLVYESYAVLGARRYRRPTALRRPVPRTPGRVFAQ
jgi:hypothetical protein